MKESPLLLKDLLEPSRIKFIKYIKNVYIDKLDDVVYKYNDTYHRAIKMNPADVKSNTHINSSKEINDENPKLKIGDIVRISR